MSTRTTNRGYVIDGVRRLCFHSATIAWSYGLATLSATMELMVQFPDVSSSLGLSQFVPPQYLGRYTFAIAALTLLARLRSIKGSNATQSLAALPNRPRIGGSGHRKPRGYPRVARRQGRPAKRTTKV
jgi:hypothetical protein